jgi:cytosine/adenosine deaminase-related metal-dependent hydrolase
MPFVTAGKIHDGNGWLPAGSVIETSADGTVISVQDGPNPDAVFYEGILMPGFVNAHCHLELSHMKGAVPEHTGLIPFLKSIPKHRNDFSDEQKKAARHNAYRELVANGIVAVGDIANTTDTLDVRALDEMHFYTFIESIGFIEANAARSFGYAVQSYDAFAAQHSGSKRLQQAIVPHAPYSVSPALFRLIDKHGEGVIISIHNQESEEENKYYTAKQGNVQDLLHTLGIDDSLFQPSGRSSLQSYLDWLSPGHPFLFVHNTYTKREDVQYAHKKLKEVYWCLCPNANLYIEQRLPDIDMLISEGANICTGTDSLASNHQLCLLSELHSIKKHYPHISWETLLSWGTGNGAKALQLQDVIGTIAVGKKPGIVQVIDLEDAGRYGVKRVG